MIPTWQGLEPFQEFAQRIEAHWDGIEDYCHEHNNVELGFVGGLNNKILGLQHRDFGCRSLPMSHFVKNGLGTPG